jgi:hypothetical protein
VRVVLAVGAAILGTAGTGAQVVEEVYPIEPAHKARVGPLPVFRLGVQGTELLKMRFRIVMSRDDFETEAYAFDQLADGNGWAYAGLGDEEQGALYRVRSSLAEGTYAWKVFAWNGFDWVAGERAFEVMIDGTPPADVDDLRLGEEADGRVRLQWSMVLVDQNGAPETVVRYHVYRFKKVRAYFFLGAFEVGVTDDTSFVDETAPLAGSPLFYKVKAEDEAGNHDRHRWQVSTEPYVRGAAAPETVPND